MKVICIGDSNTWGYDPRSYFGGRYEKEYRWTDILAEKTGWTVVNNGINGLEIPGSGFKLSESADMVIIMLGTNDILQGRTAEEAAVRMKRFLENLPVNRQSIFLVAPPLLQRGAWAYEDNLIAQSMELTVQYCKLAKELGVQYADAGSWEIPLTFDGVHFTEEGHAVFAENIFIKTSKYM